SSRRLVLSSRILPAVASRAPFGNRPMIERAVTDLPDPLSPTRQAVSPLRICRLIRLTTGAEFVWPVKLTVKSRTSRMTGAAPRSRCLSFMRSRLSPLETWIEHVARRITQKVDGEDAQRQHEPRPEDERRLELEINPALGHDVAPGRNFRTDAGAKEAE